MIPNMIKILIKLTILYNNLKLLINLRIWKNMGFYIQNTEIKYIGGK